MKKIIVRSKARCYKVGPILSVVVFEGFGEYFRLFASFENEEKINLAASRDFGTIQSVVAREKTLRLRRGRSCVKVNGRTTINRIRSNAADWRFH